ncbi:MAG: 8-oxo-dGTP diphosphatase MutT [Candidatus Rokuibacteriota bacterium]
MREPSAIVDVAAAIIRDEHGRYLLVRRRPGTHLAGLWEFPGGKREAGESITACLRRELAEELTAAFAVEEKVETIRWEYGEKTVTLHFFRCRLEAGTIAPREGQELAWVGPEGLRDYAFPPADEALVVRLRNSSRETA